MHHVLHHLVQNWAGIKVLAKAAHLFVESWS